MIILPLLFIFSLHASLPESKVALLKKSDSQLSLSETTFDGHIAPRIKGSLTTDFFTQNLSGSFCDKNGKMDDYAFMGSFNKKLLFSYKDRQDLFYCAFAREKSFSKNHLYPHDAYALSIIDGQELMLLYEAFKPSDPEGLSSIAFVNEKYKKNKHRSIHKSRLCLIL